MWWMNAKYDVTVCCNDKSRKNMHWVKEELLVELEGGVYRTSIKITSMLGSLLELPD